MEEEAELKEIKKAKRIFKSKTARIRRKKSKILKETHELSAWAKARKKRQHIKKLNRKHHDHD